MSDSLDKILEMHEPAAMEVYVTKEKKGDEWYFLVTESERRRQWDGVLRFVTPRDANIAILKVISRNKKIGSFISDRPTKVGYGIYQSAVSFYGSSDCQYDVLVTDGLMTCYAYGNIPRVDRDLCISDLESILEMDRVTHPPPVILGGG